MGVAFFGLLLIAAVVVLAILLYRSRNHGHHTSLQASTPTYPPVPFVPGPGFPSSAAAPQIGNAEAILAERLARGEISVDDYAASRRALLGEIVSSSPDATS